MNNTNRLLGNNTTNEITFPQVLFSFEQKNYTISELLKIFSADSLYLIYLHNVNPPESPCAAVRVRVPTLNFLIIAIPTPTNYKIYYCKNCPLLGPSLASQLRPLVNNQTLTQVLPPYQNHLVAHTPKQLNSSHLKCHHLSFLIKNHKHKKSRNTPTQSLLLPNLQIEHVLLDAPPTLPHHQ